MKFGGIAKACQFQATGLEREEGPDVVTGPALALARVETLVAERDSPKRSAPSFGRQRAKDQRQAMYVDKS